MSVYNIEYSTKLFTIYLSNRGIFMANICTWLLFFFTISGCNWWFYEREFALLCPLFQGLVCDFIKSSMNFIWSSELLVLLLSNLATKQYDDQQLSMLDLKGSFKQFKDLKVWSLMDRKEKMAEYIHIYCRHFLRKHCGGQ